MGAQSFCCFFHVVAEIITILKTPCVGHCVKHGIDWSGMQWTERNGEDFFFSVKVKLSNVTTKQIK